MKNIIYKNRIERLTPVLSCIVLAMVIIFSTMDLDARRGGGRGGSRGGGGRSRSGGYRSSRSGGGRGSVRHSSSRSRSHSTSSKRSNKSYNKNGGRPSKPTTRPSRPTSGRPSVPAQRPSTPKRDINKGRVSPKNPSVGRKPGSGNRRPSTMPVKRPGNGTRPSRRPSGGFHGGNKTINNNFHGSHNRGYYGHKHYKHCKDARRDWYRYRTINTAIIAGAAVLSRPRYYSTVVVTGTNYYYWGGVYYVSSGSGYVVATPPPGAVVYAVPAPTTVIYANQVPYYYINGTYYVATDAPATLPEENKADKQEDETSEKSDPEMIESDDPNYEVVPPPVGATVPYLPETATKKVIDKKTYYIDDKTYYRKFASDGDVVYMVVDKPGTISD